MHLACAAELLENLDPNDEWVWELRCHLASAWKAIKAVAR